jgi:cytochrome oxidase Cu insertion factor (SCO1/SenC/PrrC family)
VIGRRRALLLIVGVAALGVGLGVAIHQLGSGGSSDSAANPPGLHGQATWRSGERAAPGFTLADQTGQPLSLSSLRGRNVLLVFLGSRCTGGCTGEVRTLRIALRLLPASTRPVLVIVSADPAHDTPTSTRGAVARWGLGAAAAWHWLLGSRAQLAPVWRSYRIEASGAADATSPVYLIDREGYERAGLLYPFPPGWASSDLRMLAGE